jgi:hypothetical protein
MIIMAKTINRGDQKKPPENLFWVALSVSCLWFLIATAVDLYVLVTVVRDGHLRPVWAIILLIPSIALPTTIGWGILNAIRLPRGNTATLIVSRALAPLWTLGALVVLFGAIAIYKNWMRARIEQQQRTGSISFNCVETKKTSETSPSDSVKLRITELRRLPGFGDWTINWPKKTPIKAESFHADTGSIGGSQGFRWRDTDGRQLIAFVSFSDLINDFGPSDIRVAVVPRPLTSVQSKIYAGAAAYYTCDPDPKSYRE